MREQAASNRIARVLLFGYLVFLVYASLYPVSSFRTPERSPFALIFGTEIISRTDALTNVLVYLPLGWLLALSLPGLGSLRAALVGCALSLAIEYLQAYLPGRVPSILDWGLNSIGTFLGAGLSARLGHVRWHSLAVLAPGPRARLGLIAVGTWVASQLLPFVPSADIGSLREGLRPVWHVLRGQQSFSFAQAASYALATLSLASILEECLLPSRRSRLLVPLLFVAVLLAKVPIISRQLSLEALAGALVGLALSRRLRDSTPGGTVPFLAALGAFAIEELRSEGPGSGALPAFNWIPFRTHLISELIGASDILSGAWPFLALAYVVSGWRSIEPRRTALGGAVLVFAFVLGLEWLQRFLPG
ncbi:MAG TPA: VanZ family protein, partial [Vicinamibacteria bacterium]